MTTQTVELPTPLPAEVMASNGKGANIPCPECAAKGVERKFGSAQALSVHRYRSHGVAGSSNRRKAEPEAKSEGKTVVKTHLRKQRGAATETPPTPRKRRTRRRRKTSTAPVAEVMVFPSDKVLKTVFPHGITTPTREALGEVETWLREGEKIFAKSAVKTNGNSTK